MRKTLIIWTLFYSRVDQDKTVIQPHMAVWPPLSAKIWPAHQEGKVYSFGFSAPDPCIANAVACSL
jgi:hypothetical protein